MTDKERAREIAWQWGAKDTIEPLAAGITAALAEVRAAARTEAMEVHRRVLEQIQREMNAQDYYKAYDTLIRALAQAAPAGASIQCR